MLLPDGIGLTEPEARSLRVLAADDESKDRSYQDAVRTLRLEGLVQWIESGQVSEGLRRRIQDLQNEPTQIVSGQVEELRVADSRLRPSPPFSG